ncbi:YraN family protein [Streptomyces sp. bgisy126]|uniref:YraN family protein n=1 Tax=unclassified Streptomyces TaxID=2593676 RepID=UPI003EBC675A
MNTTGTTDLTDLTDTADTTGGTTGTTDTTGTIGKTSATRALGRYGEELAARRLTATGMHVLARNWRCGRTGEIDIVARDGDTLVICEVKTRRHGAYEHPMAAVTPRKAERLRRLADCWLDRSGAPVPAGGVRIDLVGVVLPRRGAPVLTHAQGVA